MPVADAVTPSRNLRTRTSPGETTPAAKKTPKATKDVEMTEAAPAAEAKPATPAKAKAATPAKPAKAAAPAKPATPAKPAAAAPPAAAKKADTKMTDAADTKKADTKADTKKADTKKAEPAKKADTKKVEPAKKADTKKAEPVKKAGTKRRAEDTEERSSKRQRFTTAPSFKVGDVIQVRIFSVTPRGVFVDHEGRRGYLNFSAIPTAGIKNASDLKDTVCPALVTDIFERDGESHFRVSCRPEDVSSKKDTSTEFKKESNATFHGVIEQVLNPRKSKGAKAKTEEKKMVSVIIIGTSPTHRVAVPREKLDMLTIVKVKKAGAGYQATPVA